MPNIKTKPFGLASTLCYQCGREIKHNDLNWSYNTRKSGMFRHQNCLLNENEFAASLSVQPKSEPEILNSIESKPIEIASDITDKITLEGKHYQTSIIKKLMAMREYPFLYGAPGAGKTHLVTSLANDMSLDCVIISCSPDMFKSEILGAVSPVTGNYHGTAFLKAWSSGGVILFDEVGLAPGSFLNVLNAGLAQKEIRFPDGKRVKIHKDCFILFADNSALYGNDPLFPERQDAGTAFRDRIAYVKFEYDVNLEDRIIQGIYEDHSRAKNWHTAVLSMRVAVDSLNVPIFVSSRFAYASAKAFKTGFSFNEVIDLYLLRGINGDIGSLVKKAIAELKGNY